MASPVQTSAVAVGFYTDAVVTLTGVTAGNPILLFGSYVGSFGSVTLTSSAGDTVVVEQVGLTGAFAIMGRIASAVGGDTTFTLSGAEIVKLVVQEWPASLAYDSAADVGVDSVAGNSNITPTTPNSSSTANSVVFTNWSVRTGEVYSGQAVPSGYTLIARETSGDSPRNGQFVAAYREDTSASVKSATWVASDAYADDRYALIWVFSDAGAGPTTEEVAETLTFADSQAGARKTFGATTESQTRTDSQAAVRHMFVARTESITFTDSSTAVLPVGAEVSETLSLADAQSSVLATSGSRSETIAFTDTQAAARASSGALAETLTFTDSSTGAREASGAVSESVTFADTSEGLRHTIGAASETLTFVDSQESLNPALSEVTESLAWSDAQVSTLHTSGSLSETLFFQDIQNFAGAVPEAPSFGGGSRYVKPAPLRPRKLLDDDEPEEEKTPLPEPKPPVSLAKQAGLPPRKVTKLADLRTLVPPAITTPTRPRLTPMMAALMDDD